MAGFPALNNTRFTITMDFLQAATDARTFQRGREYARAGRVGVIAEHDGVIEAAVRGTRPYHTELWKEKGNLLFSCTCPLGEEQIFCKHGVALGLVWLGDGPLGKKSAEDLAEPDTQVFRVEEVRRHLLSRDKSDLVDILLDQALGDDRLMRRLLLEAAKPDGLEAGTDALRAFVDEAVRHGGFIDYRESASYARSVEDAVDAIERLLERGQPAATVEMAEYALKAVENQMESVDDSDGDMRPILDRLQDIHHRACQGARPDQKQLARRLFAWELNSEWDVFDGAAATYADVLGVEGLAAYRELAEAAWAKVQPRRPGQREEREFSTRFRITRIMETLARQSGDIEKLVAIWSRDLSTAYDFLRIAEEYKEAGKSDLALQWAERGVRTFPRNTDTRLREFLAQEYHTLGRHEEAMDLVFAEFEENPRLSEYKQLKAHADRFNAWPPWREKAFSHLRKALAAEKQTTRKRRWAWKPDGSTIVEILIWEKDIEGAWLEARSEGCSEHLWLELARLREKSHPQDAIPIYQRTLEPTLARKNIDSYHEAVGTLRTIQRLMKQLGKEREFQNYLEEVRAAHRQKRNFVKLLDHVRWL